MVPITATRTRTISIERLGHDPPLLGGVGNRARNLAAIGVAGQMAGVLGVGPGWQPSTPYDSWLDLRCTPDVEHLDEAIGSALVDITGCPAMVDHAPKMRWLRREQPGAFDRTEKFLMPGSYVAGKLAGLQSSEAFIDYTYLHFTGVADAALECVVAGPAGGCRHSSREDAKDRQPFDSHRDDFRRRWRPNVACPAGFRSRPD